MAQIIPRTISPKATAGEKALFEILAKLPDDVFVYYDVQIRHRYADFVVISPRLGVLMMEIKDWRASAIVSANNDTVALRLHNGEKNLTHPLKQVRAYALALNEAIEGRLEGQILLEREGSFKGKLCFPISYAVALSNISNDDISAKGLSHVFDSVRTLTKDHIQAMQELSGAELERFLDPYFLPKFRFLPLDTVKMDQLRGIVHPHVVVRTITEKLRDQYNDGEERFVSYLRVLDSKQEQKARSIGTGHRLVFGIAGSGKTSILIARTKYLAERDPGTRGLVVCYNRPLAAYLKSQLEGFSNLTVLTFHQIAHRFGIREKDWDDAFGTKLKEAINQRSERYDFISVDEAQDFDPEWFGCIVSLLQNQSEGDLFIAGDGSQGLYQHGRKRFSWKSVGIQAPGRTEYLDENYRNARNIYQLATRFSGISSFGEIEGESNVLIADKPRSVTSGGRVTILHEKDRAGEVVRAVKLVSQLLSGKWGANDQAETINPRLECVDIGIIYPSHRGREALIAESLIPRLKQECRIPAVWISNPKDDTRGNVTPAVRIHTVHHAKGLQYRAVIFMWADLLPFFHSSVPEHDRNLFYVALTRAGQFLAITHSGDSPFVNEAKAALVDATQQPHHNRMSS